MRSPRDKSEQLSTNWWTFPRGVVVRQNQEQVKEEGIEQRETPRFVVASSSAGPTTARQCTGARYYQYSFREENGRNNMVEKITKQISKNI